MTVSKSELHRLPSRGIDGLLFPESAVNRQGLLEVGDGHRIFYQESGRRDGVPLVVVHGGPGTGSSPVLRRFFDPAYFRIILVDQRGAGRSEPAGCLEANTTQHLISDMERLREHLAIDRWLIYGGSWGATLALVYGIAHPNACRGFLLRSVALGSRQDFDWWIGGMRRFFPEAWQTFTGPIPASEREDLLQAYRRRLLSGDFSISGPAALAWHSYEGACTSHLPAPARKLVGASTEQLIHMARIEAHYFANNAFLADNWILENVHRIAHLPGFIVHGRYDVICPPLNAHELARRWSRAWLRIVDGAGHSYAERPLAAALLEAIEASKAWSSDCACSAARWRS